MTTQSDIERFSYMPDRVSPKRMDDIRKQASADLWEAFNRLYLVDRERAIDAITLMAGDLGIIDLRLYHVPAPTVDESLSDWERELLREDPCDMPQEG